LWKREGELYEWFNKNEIKHPDDMSSIILTSGYRHMNNQDIKLEEQFEEAINYYLTEVEQLARKRKLKINKIDAD